MQKTNKCDVNMQVVVAIDRQRKRERTATIKIMIIITRYEMIKEEGSQKDIAATTGTYRNLTMYIYIYISIYKYKYIYIYTPYTRSHVLNKYSQFKSSQ